ncbi:hypothetical protein AB1Y20_000614 [Prymnesium parvum]|uniref:PHD-type domain-containing protein n=1 Tax=Prymnesium parvum TaxID=97485 RepID=A0AB34K8U4_PRYPA
MAGGSPALPGDLVSVEREDSSSNRSERLEAVVNEVSGQKMRVTFDGPRPTHAMVGCSSWVAISRVKPLPRPTASTVPPWVAEGREVIALRSPPNPAQWQLATVVGLRQGLRGEWQGCRIQVRFGDESHSYQETIWLRPSDIKPLAAEDEVLECDSDEDDSLLASRDDNDLPDASRGDDSLLAASSDDDSLTGCSGERFGAEVDAWSEHSAPEHGSADLEPTHAQEVPSHALSSPSSRQALPDPGSPQPDELSELACAECKRLDDDERMILCDGPTCNLAYHIYCVSPPLSQVPEGEWLCPVCAAKGTRIEGGLVLQDLNNEAVIVRWGRGAKSTLFNAVVVDAQKRNGKGGPKIRVQFDATLQHAWVSEAIVKVMPEADEAELPSWLRAGQPVEARDPVGDSRGLARWHPATLEEVRQGVEESNSESHSGLRLWVRYTQSGLCQWLRRSHVREVGGSSESESLDQPPQAKAGAQGPAAKRRRSSGDVASLSSAESVSQLSRCEGPPGCEVWMLLDKAQPLDSSFTVWFGNTSVTAQVLAPNVLACRVPDTQEGIVPIKVKLRVEKASPIEQQLPINISEACNTFHILA